MKHQTPWVALIVGGAVGFVILVVVTVIGTLVPDVAAAVNGIILFIAVFGAVISYLMQMASFVILRRRFPAASRPYRSPTGVPGAVIAGIIALFAFVGILLAPDFRLAVITFLVIFVVGLVIFATVGRHRLVLSPEEEYALSGGLHGDPQTEGYDRMEGDVFGRE